MQVINAHARPFRGNVPFALASVVVPRQVHILGLQRGTLSPELLRDPRQQLLELRLVDDGDAIHDEDVVQALIVLDLVSACRGQGLSKYTDMRRKTDFASMSE